jgi:hypothetical protein
MAAPNIVNVSVITGKTAVQAVATSATAIVTNTAASNKVVKVNALYVSNIENSTAYGITVDIFRSSTAYRMMTAVSVPANSSLDIINKAIYLEEGDSLRLTANSANKLEAVASYEEIS